ncbi:hypothetical protein [Anaerovorax sp. IOR16]|uniref:hypothetical protein n=1 Tax=Anaerovorax sp. IOR16 TaxID=2773458 RepID=UPI0019D1E03D|nr:hypothetical protein [Anaerovorax sp. IOR16]
MKKKDPKFEEAFCTVYDDCLSVDQIEYLSMNDPEEYARIKEALFCPECKVPPLHLSHRFKNPHLKVMPGRNHDNDCSSKSDYIPRSSFKKYIEDSRNIDNLNLKLKRCINQLIEGTKKNNLDNNSNSHVDEVKNGMKLAWKGSTYAIPRKRFNRNIRENDLEIWKLFYGKNFLEWKYSDKTNKHYLRIYTEKDAFVCDIWFSEMVYSYLSSNIKNLDKGTYRIAMFGEMHKKDNYYSIMCTNSKLLEISF